MNSLGFTLNNGEKVSPSTVNPTKPIDSQLQPLMTRFSKWLNQQKDPQLRLAFNIANRVHQDDERLSPKNTPYIVHPVGVALWIIEKTNIEDPRIIITALLHDCYEDHPELFDLKEAEKVFGADVAKNLLKLTNPENDSANDEESKNTIYQDHVAESIKDSPVLVVKLADFFKNAGKLNYLLNENPEKAKKSSRKYHGLIPVFQKQIPESMYSRQLNWAIYALEDIKKELLEISPSESWDNAPIEKAGLDINYSITKEQIREMLTKLGKSINPSGDKASVSEGRFHLSFEKDNDSESYIFAKLETPSGKSDSSVIVLYDNNEAVRSELTSPSVEFLSKVSEFIKKANLRS